MKAIVQMYLKIQQRFTGTCNIQLVEGDMKVRKPHVSKLKMVTFPGQSKHMMRHPLSGLRTTSNLSFTQLACVACNALESQRGGCTESNISYVSADATAERTSATATASAAPDVAAEGWAIGVVVQQKPTRTQFHVQMEEK